MSRPSPALASTSRGGAAAAPLRLSAPEVKRRVGRTALALLLLLAAWPLLGHLYRPLYRALAPAAVNLFGTKVQLVAKPAADSGMLARDTARMDTVILVKHKDYPTGHGKLPTSTLHHGYLPTAILLALVWGATSGGWKEKQRLLLWSVLSLHAFLAVRIAAAVVGILNVSVIDGRPALDLGATGAWVIDKTKSLLWDEPAIALLAPIVLWAVFAFDRPPRATPAPR